MIHGEVKRKKRLYKILYVPCLLSIMLIIFITSYTKVKGASTNISLSNWYSDAYNGYWSTAPNVYFTNLSSSINIVPYINSAVNKWNNVGISSMITNTTVW